MTMAPLYNPIACFEASSLCDSSDDEQPSTSASKAFRNTGETVLSPVASSTILGFSDGLISSYYAKSYDGKGKVKDTEEEWVRNECKDWKVSRIGGRPYFPANLLESTSPLSPNLFSCGSCHRTMPLLVQIYCPLYSSPYERIVYIFGCPKRTCRRKPHTVKSWRVNILCSNFEENDHILPEQQADRTNSTSDRGKIKNEDEKAIGNMIFGGSLMTKGRESNPFAAVSSSSSALNPFISKSGSFPAVSSSSTLLSTPSFPESDPIQNSISSQDGKRKSTSLNIPALTASHSLNETKENLLASTMPGNYSKDGEAEKKSEDALDCLQDSEIPFYSPHYLATAYESTVSSTTLPEAKISPLGEDKIGAVEKSSSRSREGKGSGGRVKKGATRSSGSGVKGAGVADGWGKEGYEVQTVRGVDRVLLRFQEVVGRDPEQVVRYCFSSAPTPFSASSKPYSTTFPSGQYSPIRIPPCPHCNGPCVFELQLMPNLCNILNKALLVDPNKQDVVEEGNGHSKKSEGNDKNNVLGDDGLDFASIWVFACLGECGHNMKGASSWCKEEQVLVEWETY